MAAGDLINSTRALDNLNNRSLSSNESTTLNDLITAVSKAIKTYCRRDFTATTYDELYSGNGSQRLLLREYPIIDIQKVSYGPYAVMRVWNNAYSTVQRATVAVTSTSDANVTGDHLTLISVASGVTTTDTSTAFGTYATIQQAVNNINSIGSGWQASVPNSLYANWPTSDLRIQGALNCAQGTYAEIKDHVIDMSDFQIDRKRGWLIRGINALVTQWDDPLAVWTPGVDNYRVIYDAGYNQTGIPADLQEACAEWVASLFWMTKGNPSVYPNVPPPHVALILEQYRKCLPMPI